MKQRLENCKYCGKKLEDGTTRKEFCSDIHRVYWHRENPKVTLKNFNNKTNEVSDVTKPAETTNYTINTVRPKKYDYSKMPKKLTFFEQMAWKEKARKEQDLKNK